MKIDAEDLVKDESKSNPMAVAITHPKCQISRPCFYMVVGSGAITEQCKHFKAVGEAAECEFEEMPES